MPSFKRPGKYSTNLDGSEGYEKIALKNRSGKDILYMKTKQILMAGALALSMVLSGGMLTGCSNSSTKDTKTSEVAKKKEVKTIGQKTKDSKSLKFTNITGKKITC